MVGSSHYAARARRRRRESPFFSKELPPGNTLPGVDARRPETKWPAVGMGGQRHGGDFVSHNASKAVAVKIQRGPAQKDEPSRSFYWNEIRGRSGGKSS